MKKILFALSLIAFMFLSGCSSSIESTTTMVNLDKIIEYNLDNLKFSYLNESDLLNYVVNEGKDFKIMLNIAYDNGVIDSLHDSNNGVMDTLTDLSDASGIKIAIMLSYSATELNELAVANSIALTVDDIVGFMDLLKIKDQLSGSLFISKIEYLEIKLGRELTSEEEDGLSNLQDAYNQLFVYSNSNYDISDKTFIQLVEDLDELSYEYTQEDYDSIEVGFNIIIEIIN
ncbi:hypothetical protein RJI07_04630 [Mycoplasmatota bacterium WC30]